MATLEPITRVEQFLSDIIDQGGGGGSGGGVLIVNDVNGTLDKTWQEIKDAEFSVLKTDVTLMFYVGAQVIMGGYSVGYFNPITSSISTWTAMSENGYPENATPDLPPSN